VNNAAKPMTKKIIDYTDEEITTTIGTNFVSGYHLCQLAHPLLKQSGYGSVVFTSSVAGLKAIPTLSVYAATKGMFAFL
jgi:Tropinone reductase 1